MADGELLDAREAMSLLGINENELQTLVARGDLRAFRSAGTMKFRRDDVSSLKAEKGTEPTIIIPASGTKKTGGSGILPTVGGAPPKRPSAIGQAVSAPAAPSVVPPAENDTGQIVLDDIELMPTDDAAGTQQVTIQTGTHTAAGGQTVVEPGTSSASITGDMTVLEGGAGQATTGAATAVTGTGVGSGVKRGPAGSGIAPAGAPAMSRVQRAAAAPGVSMATSRRTAAVYQPKTAHPIMTAIMILTTVVFAFAASIAVVMVTRGSYDGDRVDFQPGQNGQPGHMVVIEGSHQRIIPPFLGPKSPLNAYKSCYKKTPGDPQDPKPQDEYAGQDNTAQ
jgi:hypothetical protein